MAEKNSCPQERWGAVPAAGGQPLHAAYCIVMLGRSRDLNIGWYHLGPERSMEQDVSRRAWVHDNTPDNEAQ